jgi:hypothetical protein
MESQGSTAPRTGKGNIVKATAKLRHRNTTQARTANTHTQYATLNGKLQAQLTRGAIIRTGDILTALGLGDLPDGKQSWYGRHAAKAYRTARGLDPRRVWVQHRTTARWIAVYVYSPADPALTTALYTYKATREALAAADYTEAA